MYIRRMTEWERPMVQAIHDENHISAGGTLAGPLSSDPHCFVLEKERRILAYMTVLDELPPRVGETRWYCTATPAAKGVYIRQAAVSRREQGKGLGRTLYTALYALFPRMPVYAHVRAGTQPVFEFYLRQGFRPVGEFRSASFYGIPDYRAYLMMRPQDNAAEEEGGNDTRTFI